jgi:Protein of unknown function (DUF1549)
MVTAACAQCHNHKFDPIPTTDYYALLGVFSSSEESEYPLAPEAAVNEYKAREKKVREQDFWRMHAGCMHGPMARTNEVSNIRTTLGRSRTRGLRLSADNSRS